MENENKVSGETLDTQGEQDTTPEVESETEVEESSETTNEAESIEEVKARLAKAEELARNYKVRAEKAEKGSGTEKKAGQPVQKKAQDGELSSTDLYALLKGGVEQEDIPEIQDYAKLKGISITEALKAPIVKTILNEKEEMRKTAQATHVGASKKGGNKLSDDALLRMAEKGEIPESSEDMARLFRLRKGIK